MADIQKRIAQLQAVRKKTKSEAGKKAIDSKIAKLEAQAQEAKVEKPVEKEVEAPVEKPKKERKPRAKAEPKAKPKKASRFVFEKPVDGGKEVKVVEAMTEAEAKEAMDGTDFDFVKQITRGRSPREGFVADKKAPAKKKEAEKPKRKPRASKDERTSMAKAAGMSETRAKKISEKVATGKKRGRKPMDKEAWLFEMPLKTQAGKVKRKIVKATNEKAAIKSAGASYKLVRKLSEGESPKVGTMEMEGYVAPPKRGRGRPKGAKNKVKASAKPSRMPSKRAQAAIKAKSEDIGEGIAIADSHQFTYKDIERKVEGARDRLIETISPLRSALDNAKSIMLDLKGALEKANLAYEELLPDEEGHGLAIRERGGIMDLALENSLIEKLSETRDDIDSYTIFEDKDGYAWEDFMFDEQGTGFASRNEAIQDFLDYLNKNFAKGGKVKRGDYESALQEAIAMGVNFERDFHAQSIGGEMDELATKYGYRKPKSASGSKGRMFFQKLQRMDSKKMAEGGTTEGKPKVENEEVYLFRADGEDISYELLDDPRKTFALQLDGAEVQSRLADHNIFLEDYGLEEASFEDIVEELEERDVLRAGNTYNDNLPFVYRISYIKGKEPYDEGVIFVKKHLGGDVRGNYDDYMAFVDSVETNPMYGDFYATITTDKGMIELRSEGLEGYNWEVMRDETGTLDEGDYIDVNEIEEVFNWGDVESDAFGIY